MIFSQTSTRRCLLALGTAGLAAGRPLDEVESELRRMGRAQGEDAVQCAATPTGLFVSLDGEDATGFRAVGPPLRFDQAGAVSRIVDAVLAGRCDPDDAIERLDAVLAAPPLLPRWAAAAGLITVSAGIRLIIQPAPENLLVPSFWLLVPGSLGLIGTTQLATDTGDGFATASGAIAVIVAIALGVLVGSAIGRALSR